MITKYGSLIVTSDPDGAECFINGKSVENTQYKNETMEPGKYIIKVVKDYTMRVLKNSYYLSLRG